MIDFTDIKKVGIILKKDFPDPGRVCADVLEWFAGRSVETVIDDVTPDMDILVILGGDGTLLHVADRASRFGIPVIGVNLGDLGFLTEVSVDERNSAFESIMRGTAVIENRMMIKARLCRATEFSEYRYALNDVVISKGNIDHLVKLDTWADQEYITTYKADGLIFSTPTGSTAYNLSAGGPVVQPGLDSILVTPICPFMLGSRPVLLPPDTKLATKPAGSINDLKVIIDGQAAWDMKENDLLEVEASDRPLRLICSPSKGYFGILRSKLNWGGGRVKGLENSKPLNP